MRNTLQCATRVVFVQKVLQLLSQKLIYALHLTRKRMLSILVPLHRHKAPKKVTNNPYPLLQHAESVVESVESTTTHSTDL